MPTFSQIRPRKVIQKGLSESLFQHTYVKWAMFALALVFIVILFPRGMTFQYADYTIGSVIDKEIIAPFDFPILKTEEELASERNEARKSVLPYFEKSKGVSDGSIAILIDFFKRLRQIHDLKNSVRILEKGMELTEPDSTRYQRLLSFQARLDSVYKGIYHTYGIDVKEVRWNFLLQDQFYFVRSFENQLNRILRDLYAIGIIDQNKSNKSDSGNEITIMERNGDVTQVLKNLYDLEEARAEASSKIQHLYSSHSDTAAVGYELLVLSMRPNIIFNQGMTGKLRDEAVNRVPLTRGFVLKNQRIIDGHEIVTPDAYRKIQSLRMAIPERNKTQGGLHAALPFIGKGLFVAILLFLLFYSIYHTRKKIFADNLKVALILVILLLEVVFAFGIVQHAGLSEYLIPTTMSAMLFVVLFDSGVAFIATVVVSLLIGGFLGNEFAITVITIFTGMVALRTVRKLRQRSQFFKAIPIIAGAYLIAIVALGLVRYMPVQNIFSHYWKYCIPNSIVSPILTLGLLYIFEMGSGISTSIRLLELSDMNHPLLKSLAVEAPGTYHHSIIMGNIAEAAAESIGANSLLTRVGAYYHDVGKISKSEYFTENQVSIKNPHEKLAPTMSRLIIANHVREGIDLAKMYRLPQDIIDMIAQHHGTSKISFFYEKAIERTDARLVQEEDYRYQGPKPQTRETGIIMLADTMEAASRSLKNPSISRIREIVSSTIEKKFKDGELGDCELSLRDLDRLKDSFINSLIGLHHSRLEYPSRENGQAALRNHKSAEKAPSHNN